MGAKYELCISERDKAESGVKANKTAFAIRGCIPIVCYRYLYNTQRENASVELTYASRRGII